MSVIVYFVFMFYFFLNSVNILRYVLCRISVVVVKIRDFKLIFIVKMKRILYLCLNFLYRLFMLLINIIF